RCATCRPGTSFPWRPSASASSCAKWCWPCSCAPPRSAASSCATRTCSSDSTCRNPWATATARRTRGLLRGDKSAVTAYLAEKDDRLQQRLRDKYVEDFDDVEQKVLRMREVATSASRKESVHGLLAVIASCGCRKVEVLDPEIEFHAYQDYVRRTTSASDEHS